MGKRLLVGMQKVPGAVPRRVPVERSLRPQEMQKAPLPGTLEGRTHLPASPSLLLQEDEDLENEWGSLLLAEGLAAEREGKEPPGSQGEAEVEVASCYDRVTRLMEKDPAFRRGRLRWLRQEQARLQNLQQQQQQLGRSLRRNQPHGGMPGKFIPPQDCKLRFPFKSNPQHRYSWGPNSGFMVGGSGGEKEPGASTEGPQAPSPKPARQGSPPPQQKRAARPARRNSLEGGHRGRRGQGQEQYQARKHSYYPRQHQPYPQHRPPGNPGSDTPPRMRRQRSAPNLQQERESAV